MKIRTLNPSVSPLPLTNDGHLEVCFIGVGSAFAHRNYQTNLILIKGDQHIMVDFGMTAPRALKDLTGLEVTDLDTFLITHSHADHIGGLECAGLLNRYVGIPHMDKEKLSMIITEGYQEVLWDRSLRGGMEWNEEENGKRLSFTDFFDPIRPRWKNEQPREIFHVNVGGIELEMFRTVHVPDNAMSWDESFTSYGIMVDGHVFISMDTQFDRSLIDLFAHQSSVMFHDVQFFPGGVHAPLDDLKTLPEWIKEKMLLMHYPDNWEDQNITGFAGWTRQGVVYSFEKDDLPSLSHAENGVKGDHWVC